MNCDMAKSGFEVVEHTADWALRVVGPDMPALFIQAALGMGYLMAGELDELPLSETRQLSLEAYDAESLLVDWLSELAYWAETARLVFREFDMITLTPTHLEAIVKGGPAHELHKEIKAVTYHDLAIVETAVGLEVTIVFDV